MTVQQQVGSTERRDAGCAGSRSPRRMTRADWLRAALEVLVSEGIDQLKAQSVARKMNVSRSSFYWFFPHMEDLYNDMISHWLTRNTGPIIERAMKPAPTITKAVCNVFECWMDSDLFDPELDMGVRLWARRDAWVRAIVEQSDVQRVDALRHMFSRYGIAEEEAFTRARVLYFTQIGHYTLKVSDSLEARLAHLRSYLLTFTGALPDDREISEFASCSASIAPAPKATHP